MTAIQSREALADPDPDPDPDADPGQEPGSSILLVDDNAAKRLALRSVLLPLGFPIVEADSGQAALRCLLVQDFAVILLDVCMPVMDGFETAALIRQRRQSELTPIIFITAYSNDELGPTDRYVEGAVDFIFAPVPPDELRAKVSVFANIHQKAETLASRAREMQNTADQLRLLSEAAPIGIFRTDSDNRYLYTNPRWSEITGIGPHEAAGRAWDSIIDPEQRTGLVDRAEGAELSQRFHLQPSGGADVRVVQLNARPVAGDAGGGQDGWVGTLADVTAEAGAEAAMAHARDQATEASRQKSDFLANMSHEIRTPMNGVIGMTDLLLETDLDDEQRDYAQTVRNSGEALLGIIEDVLDFSSVEAGRLEVERIDYDVRRVVDDALAPLQRSAQARKLGLVAVVDDAVPHLVCGDPGRVRQVLANYIDNAMKFTAAGEVVVRVTGEAETLRFEVSDTGLGIAADKQQAIFEPFVQADTSTTRRYGGTGLGLAICDQLVRLMGGACGVTSELGVGSRFWFTVRAHAAAGDPVVQPVPAGPAERAAAGAVSPATARLLLAEDNPINQKVAVAMLASAGYVVDTVPDGAAAVAAVAGQTYDAILMDCQMPELNGYQATAAIRAQEGTDRHTPIIALTAGARREDRDRCLAEGMDSYLAKPVRKDALLAMVARSLRADRPS